MNKVAKNMVWRRKGSEESASPCYVRFSDGGLDEEKIPKGYVPMMVGDEDDGERVLVPVRLLKEPCMGALLDMAAQQFGYCQQGVLRIPCDTHHFRRVVGVMSKA